MVGASWNGGRDRHSCLLEAAQAEAQRIPHHGMADVIVIVANPPAFWYHTAHRAITVPNADIGTLLAACDRYGVDYVVLGHDRLDSLGALYEGIPAPVHLILTAEFEGHLMLWKAAP